LLIGPTGLQTALLSRVNAAQSELLVMMYQLTVRSFVDAFIAAKNRGVDVRVLLDGAQTVNNDARQRLTTAGVPVKTAPARYTNNHAKVIVVDRTEAVVMSANLNGYSMSSERNYGAALQDGQDIADLVTIFEVDWADSAILDLSCTRLLVSPVNSRTRLDGLIRGARQRLDLAVMYISDSSLRDAVKARAAAGVPVRVLLADPAWIDGNQATATELAAAGIAVRFLRSWELHAKLVLSDDTAFVGSQNLSWTSLERNREVGLFVTEPAPESAAARQFEIDWSQGDPP
jgi:phosphatidylserine/phosphatidylglycerophosphate/cardiolipin synthase-like enzyme